MGVLSRIFTRESTATGTTLERRYTADDVALLREGMADLELALEDRGWDALLSRATDEFSRAGLLRNAAIARTFAVAHPLIKRGLGLRQAYVWGQGVQVAARADGNGHTGEQDVNAVVQAFLDDKGNRRAFTGDQAHARLERALGTDGNVFLAGFTSPLTGKVRVRTLPYDEIDDVITNPGDRQDHWFYRRSWVEETVAAGTVTTQRRVAYYPAMGYKPAPGAKPKTINEHPVMWDAPVLHVKVNELEGWLFGIGDAYAALPWARGYRDFLGDWATLVKALSQFAFRLSTKGSKAQKARAAFARRPTTAAPDGNPNSVGGTVVMADGDQLEAIPKTGATIDSESGRPLAAMIAAGLGIPVTMLLADPGTTGARATAETLDKPVELEMNGRRAVWADVYQTILEHVIIEAVRAPQGPLKGVITRDPETTTETVALAGDTDATVEVTWPDLTDTPLDILVKAIVEADGTGKVPPEQIARLLMQTLGVKDIDEILEDFLDENGRWVDPLATAGQAAVDAFNQGKDPAALVGAQAGDDDPDEDA